MTDTILEALHSLGSKLAAWGSHLYHTHGFQDIEQVAISGGEAVVKQALTGALAGGLAAQATHGNIVQGAKDGLISSAATIGVTIAPAVEQKIISAVEAGLK